MGEISAITEAFEAKNVTPAQVTGVTIEAGDTDGTLVVRWSPVLNADSYIVKVNGVDQDPVTISPYTIDGEAGTLYRVTVRAVREHADDGPESDPKSHQATRVAGSGVTGLTLERGDDATDIDASWDADERASSYELAWRKRGTTRWFDATVTGTSYTIDGEGNSTYEVRVRAIVPHSAESEPWSPIQQHTTGAAAPATPTGFGVRQASPHDHGATNGSMILTWNAARNAQGYKIEQTLDGATTEIAITGGTVTSRLVSGTPGKLYSFTIRSTRTGASDSAKSASVSITARNLSQNPPSGYTASGQGNRVNMSWSAPQGGVTSYIVNYREVGASAWMPRIDTRSLNASFTGTLGVQYETRVRAVGRGSDGTEYKSTYLPSVNVRLLAPPTGLSATFSFRRGGTTFRWAAIPHASFYEYELESPQGRSLTPRPVRTTGREFFSAAAGTGTYRLRVRAGTSNSYSAWATLTGTL